MTDGAANATKVILVQTPNARIPPISQRYLRLCSMTLEAKYRVRARVIVSIEFENGRTRKVKVIGEEAKSRRQREDLEVRQREISVV